MGSPKPRWLSRRPLSARIARQRDTVIMASVRELIQRVPKKYQLIGAKILLKLLDYGVFIFVFVLVSTFATVIYVELYYGSSMYIIIMVSLGIFFTMVFLG